MVRNGFIAVVLLVAAVFGWRWYDGQQKAELERALATDAAAVVSVSFAKARELKVYSAKGKLVGRLSDVNSVGITTTRITKAPFTVDYFIDLAKLDKSKYRWDAASKTMFVEVPDVQVAKPNVDEQKAEVDDSGWFVSREAAARLQRKASIAFANGASVEANKPVNVEAARRSAVEVVGDLTTAPLAAAGLTGVRVVARFASDRTSDARWDTSRALEDVLGGQ